MIQKKKIIGIISIISVLLVGISSGSSTNCYKNVDVLTEALYDDSSFFATEVIEFTGGGNIDPVLGGPRGEGDFAGSTHVLSLGSGGSITLGFDQIIGDGPGADFIVFENPFYLYSNPDTVYAELVFVEVSSDGQTFVRFPCISNTDGGVGGYSGIYPENITNLAGVWPVYANVDENNIDSRDPAVAGGDAFDLHDLINKREVIDGDINLQNINYIRLVDIIGDGTSYDSYGNPIYDPTTSGNNGADIDAVAIVNIGTNNAAPQNPTLTGPSDSEINDLTTFFIQTTDPNEDQVFYYINWADGTDTEWIGPYDSGELVSLMHTWTTEGSYQIQYRAKDEHELASSWGNHQINISDGETPNTPMQPDGPIYGLVNGTYSYKTSSTDPNGDDLQYIMNWGDGSYSNWTGFIDSGRDISIQNEWNNPGEYHIQAKARDRDGLESSWSSATIVTISECDNTPPDKPEKPSGPSVCKINVSCTYFTVTNDTDLDQVRYGFDWDGDGNQDGWSGYINSGEPYEITHQWNETGSYQIKVLAEDECGAKSEWSDVLIVIISEGEQHPPEKPETPSGKKEGRNEQFYLYTTCSMDPNGDNIYYKWDWGNEISDWDGPYQSGEQVIGSHCWREKGQFEIRVKAKDINDLESEWSDPLTVSMPLSHLLSQFTLNEKISFLYRIVSILLRFL